MGSVIDYIECPRCKSDECFEDFYYKTGESMTYCLDCGYEHIYQYKRDENGKLVLKDETKKCEFDNLIPEEILNDNPYGAYKVTSLEGGSTLGSLKTEEDYHEFVTNIKSMEDLSEIEDAVVSRFIDGKIEREIIYSNNAE